MTRFLISFRHLGCCPFVYVFNVHDTTQLSRLLTELRLHLTMYFLRGWSSAFEVIGWAGLSLPNIGLQE